MNANEVLRIVDSLHRDKNIEKEVVFTAIESALVSAARKHFGDEADIEFIIDRESGQIAGRNGQEELDYEEVIGRIGAQTAKQVIIQKVREAERDSQIIEFNEIINDIITGTVHRNEGRVTTVTLGGIEAILPRSEQIPGESHQPNERIRALVTEVKPQGSRVKVVLSRTRPKMVQRLFETEIPEIADGVISINAISREPGYRSKVAVSSIDSKVDCVGACVGVRGNRIKTVIDELAGERIDIVRYDEDPQVMIPNSLQPAEVDEVILCQMLGRAIVLVREDQLSLAIGKRGQNVRLASKLCGWDIEIMTQEELEQQIERAVQGFCSLDGVADELANRLVGEGYLSYDDLSVIEPDDLMEMGELTSEQVDHIVNQAEARAEEAERIAEEENRQRRAAQKAAEALAAAEAVVAAKAEAEAAAKAEAEAAAAGTATETGEESSPSESPVSADSEDPPVPSESVGQEDSP
ncbi:MAG: transcription termination factor NusA [Mariniblastus sp.]|nr:transcription termination factor NusA [Mariniblastus sp.]